LVEEVEEKLIKDEKSEELETVKERVLVRYKNIL